MHPMDNPIIQTMLLAERVYVDKDTGTHIIAGVFTGVSSKKFPFFYREGCSLFLTVIDIRASAKLRIEFCFYDQESEPFGARASAVEVELKPSSGADTMNLKIECPPLPIPKPGNYAFVAYLNGVLQGRLRLKVSAAEGD